MSLPIYQRVAVTDAGDVIPGAEYTVINENTGVAAPIYSDRTGATLLTAPYFADSAGTIQFFIAQGTTFRVAASGGVGTYTDRYVYGVAEAVLVQADGTVNIGGLGSNDGNIALKRSSDGLTVGNVTVDSVGSRFVMGTAYSNIDFFTEQTNFGMRIKNGNVGIGTSSPGNKFVVAEGTNQHGVEIVPGFLSYIQAYDRATSDYGDLKIDSKTIAFGTNNGSERMRIDSAGNLLVGITSSPGNKFRVLADTNNLAYLSNTSGTGVYLQSGATSWTGVSDERVKDIIEPITGAMSKFATLRTVIGKYKTDAEGTRRPFLIAQDVQAVFPEVVDTQDDEAGTLGLQYEGLIPSMIAAMKEQQTLIEALVARIEILEAK